MKIHEAKPYKNKDGKTESAKQHYFFMEYWKIRSQDRSIPNLDRILTKKEEEGTLEHPRVKPNALYKYRKEFEWDERIFKYHQQDSRLIAERIDDDLNEYRKAQTELNGTLAQLKALREHTNFAEANYEDREEIRQLLQQQNTYNDTAIIMLDMNVGLNEMISSAGILNDLRQTDEDKLPMEDLLSDDEEEDEEDL